MFVLAHISDIHLGPLPKVTRRQLFSKRITGFVNFRRTRTNSDQPEITTTLIDYLKSLNPDHTVITGDLINLGLQLEIDKAAEWLENLGDSADTTLVLGNHDAYVPGARDKAMAAWQKWICGDDKATISSEKDYPILRRRGEISIIGCNSARASAPFLATGYFKKHQAKKLEALLKTERAAGQCCVVLIHHPPHKDATARYKRLINSERFRKVIASAGAELILHGHTHLDTLAYLEGPDKKVPVVCVPAAYQWAGGRKPAAGVNLIRISKKLDEWSIDLERHGLEGISEITFHCLSKQIF